MSARNSNTQLWQQLGYIILLLTIVLGSWFDFSLWTILSRALIVWAAYSILVLLGLVTYNYWQLEQRRKVPTPVGLPPQVAQSPQPESKTSESSEAEKE
jgi:hypothetical protein